MTAAHVSARPTATAPRHAPACHIAGDSSACVPCLQRAVASHHRLEGAARRLLEVLGPEADQDLTKPRVGQAWKLQLVEAIRGVRDVLIPLQDY